MPNMYITHEHVVSPLFKDFQQIAIDLLYDLNKVLTKCTPVSYLHLIGRFMVIIFWCTQYTYFCTLFCVLSLQYL